MASSTVTWLSGDDVPRIYIYKLLINARVDCFKITMKIIIVNLITFVIILRQSYLVSERINILICRAESRPVWDMP